MLSETLCSRTLLVLLPLVMLPLKLSSIKVEALQPAREDDDDESGRSTNTNRGAAPVQTSTANNVPTNFPEIMTILGRCICRVVNFAWQYQSLPDISMGQKTFRSNIKRLALDDPPCRDGNLNSVPWRHLPSRQCDHQGQTANETALARGLIAATYNAR